MPDATATSRVTPPRENRGPDRPLRILHVIRAPVGGAIRHVLDLAQGQVSRGHAVGILADNLTGGERATATLAAIAPRLALGVHRLPIRREPRPQDALSYFRFVRLARRLRPDVLHGHGAQAGAFVRLHGARPGLINVYTPHGGSLNYTPDTLQGKIYSRIERALMNRTSLFLFESGFARDTFLRIVGRPKGLVRLVFNGVADSEFEPITTVADATDLVFVGELRANKGPDLLIAALARLHAGGRPATLTMAGDGVQSAELRAQVERLGLSASVRFIGHVAPRFGFSHGRLLVIPSRADSMPYVVIEAAAAGQPMISARVGGIPEIFGRHDDALFPGHDPEAMARAIAAALDDPAGVGRRAAALREDVMRQFSQDAMVDGVLAGYADAFAAR